MAQIEGFGRISPRPLKIVQRSCVSAPDVVRVASCHVVVRDRTSEHTVRVAPLKIGRRGSFLELVRVAPKEITRVALVEQVGVLATGFVAEEKLSRMCFCYVVSFESYHCDRVAFADAGRIIVGDGLSSRCCCRYHYRCASNTVAGRLRVHLGVFRVAHRNVLAVLVSSANAPVNEHVENDGNRSRNRVRLHAHCDPVEGRQNRRRDALLHRAVGVEREADGTDGEWQVREAQGHEREHDGRREPRAPEREPRLGVQREVHDDEALGGEEHQSEGRELLRLHVECVQNFAGPIHFDGPTQIPCALRHVPDAISDEAESAFNQYIN